MTTSGGSELSPMDTFYRGWRLACDAGYLSMRKDTLGSLWPGTLFIERAMEHADEPISMWMAVALALDVLRLRDDCERYWMALYHVASESEGHGDIGSRSYDMTLDDIHETAQAALYPEKVDA